MSIWLQRDQERVYHLVPDGRTRTDLVAHFLFSNDELQSTSPVRFRIGAGSVLDENGDVREFSTEQEIIDAVRPVEGLELSSGEATYTTVLTQEPDGTLTTKRAAKVTIFPVPTFVKADEALVVAYNGYDESGDTQRLSVAVSSFPISSSAPVVSPTLEYDPGTNTWTEKSSMPTPRQGAFSGSDGTSIYVMGGYSSEFLSSNEYFDGSSWSSSVQSPSKRAYGTCSYVNGYFYLIGGIDSSGTTSLVERFDPSSGEWEEMSSCPTQLAFHASEIYGQSIYCFFGCTSVNSDFLPERFNSGILRYDTQSNVWQYEDVIVPSGISSTLSSAAAAGDNVLQVNSSDQFPPSGVVTLERGTSNELSVPYLGFDSGFLVLSNPLPHGFSSGAQVDQSSLGYGRLCPNVYLDSSPSFVSFNGIVMSLTTGEEIEEDNAKETYDPSSKSLTVSTSGPSTRRFRASLSKDASYAYVACGSDEDSDWNTGFENIDLTTGGFSPLTDCPQALFGAVSEELGGLIYVIGGSSSMRPSPWYRIRASCQPSTMTANGMQDICLSVVVDDSQGNDCPDGTSVDVTTLIIARDSSGNDLARIDGEVVLMTTSTLSTVSGRASLVVEPRGEDYIKGVDEARGELSSFVIGEKNLLYQILFTAQISGVSSTNGYSTAASQVRIGTENKVAFQPTQPMAQQGASARLSVVLNTPSIPDTRTIISDASALLTEQMIDQEKLEIPSGCSPFYDGMFEGAKSRIPFPTSPPRNMVIGITDDYENKSSNVADDVASEANSAIGPKGFPLFVVGLSTNRPVSLAARSDTTDVPGYDYMSEQTGGDSYSLLDPTYSPSIIARIKSDAESSPGRGGITISHSVSGFLTSLEYVVSNLISGNSASMTLSYSSDGREYFDLGVEIPPNTTYVLPTPLDVVSFHYSVTLSSQTFDSPVLESASFSMAIASSQYVFTYPIAVSGEVAEIAGVVNHRIPSPGSSSFGVCHGSSTYFDRDYVPSSDERGVLFLPNRSTDTVAADQVTNDIMDSDDLILYRARGGPWPQDAELTVYVNGLLASDYESVPELGLIRFESKKSPDDIVTVSVSNPSTFRFGLKVTNPTLSVGRLDSFAYSFGETKRDGEKNQLPRAVNARISPEAVRPGGPMTANYVYQDSNGNPEEESLTRIIWYRNGIAVTELTNLRTFTDANLNASSDPEYKIRKGQVWFFGVRPNDGIGFGPEAKSPAVVIQDGIPSVQNVTINPQNGDEFLSNDNIEVIYDFYDPDGDSDVSVISFYADGNLVQEGTSNVLLAGETNTSGQVIISPGRRISATVTPYDSTEYGVSVSTTEIIVGYVTPQVTAVDITPTDPSSAVSLQLTYNFVDPDGFGDQSLVTWYKNEVRVTSLENQKSVPPSYTVVGQSWQAIVTPYNGSRTGESVESPSVTIRF